MKVRLTARKAAILRMQDHDEGCYDEFGLPPYAATDIGQFIDWFGGDNGREWIERPDGAKEAVDPLWRVPASTVQSFARTLRGMARDGLLVSVRDKQQTFNGMCRTHIDMPCVCYFSARTMDRDIRRAQAWHAAHEARYGWEPKTFERFMGAAEDIGLPALKYLVSLADDTSNCEQNARAVEALCDAGAAPVVGLDGEWQLF